MNHLGFPSPTSFLLLFQAERVQGSCPGPGLGDVAGMGRGWFQPPGTDLNPKPLGWGSRYGVGVPVWGGGARIPPSLGHSLPQPGGWRGRAGRAACLGCDPKLCVPPISFIPWLCGHRVRGFVPFKRPCPEPVLILRTLQHPKQSFSWPRGSFNFTAGVLCCVAVSQGPT